MGTEGRDGGGGALFETTAAEGRQGYRLFAGSVLVGISLIWAYRATHIPAEGGAKWAWIALLAADVWFGLYWLLTQSVRWSPSRRQTFKNRLSQRYKEELPTVDVFVCTADPKIEPPALVMNTVLSVMAYDYPPEKLSVYLSDDGGSELTFYALLQAAGFAREWIPFCRRFQVEPRSPAAYFRAATAAPPTAAADERRAIEKLYKEMEENIRTVTELGRIPEDIRGEHKGFLEWLPGTTSRDHQSIVQILIDGREPDAVDVDGRPLPTLVYVAREKRPHRHHNFKAGAMNSLMRVSSEISGGRMILNVDCDMYSNDSQSVRDAMCFFMDEGAGDEIGYVQFAQKFENVTKNDLYGSSLTIITEVDFHGLDGVGGPLYTGSGCFHRRWSLMGNKYSDDFREDWKAGGRRSLKEISALALEQRAKVLADCIFEDNTEWGNEVGLKYGCPVEDVITGLSIQCKGWKSVFFNPTRGAFLGIAPMTLSQTILQHKRWSEGDFQILLSPFSPFLYGRHSTGLLLQMGYSIYCLWAPNSIPTICYSLIPSLSLLGRTTLYPQVSSLWFLPFAYVAVAAAGYGLWEALRCGMTARGWWNEWRMWLYKRFTSYLFGFLDTLLLKAGFRNSTFVITEKVTGKDVAGRFEREEMEFGASSPSLSLTILATLAMVNLFCLAAAVWRMAAAEATAAFLGEFFFQLLICGLLVAINGPVYRAMFFRKDGGRMAASVTVTSTAAAAAVVCLAAALMASPRGFI
ncbi:unnamed protein product [Spirodela intermedia]|uniref:Uncharacterized protein n=1 Tax=Spirodela intermedia TaxID=51605 RepID=A0A7I8LES6_SPIIN|nr:unnamed protein product [Spirodela intermedia]